MPKHLTNTEHERTSNILFDCLQPPSLGHPLRIPGRNIPLKLLQCSQPWSLYGVGHGFKGS